MSTGNRGGRGTSAPAGDRVTKAERKAQARVEREAIQRQMARKRRTRRIVVIVALVAAAAAIGAAVLTSSPGEDRASGDLPGMMTSTQPWTNNLTDLGGRLAILDLPGLSEQVLHRHARLDLFVNGQPVAVPANIGLDADRGLASPLHTHETSYLIHTESDDPNFTTDLGTFFDVWGLRLTQDCLGAYCTEGEKQVRVFVGGEQVQGDPRQVPLDDLAVIVVTYGTTDELPDPIPSSFAPET